MPYIVAFAFSMIVGQGIALPHHAVLAVRTRAAASQGAPELVEAKQTDLLRLQAAATAVLALSVAIRAALGGDAAIAFTYGGLVFGSVFAVGVYLFYPEAATIGGARYLGAPPASTRRLGVFAWSTALLLFLGVVVVAR